MNVSMVEYDRRLIIERLIVPFTVRDHRMKTLDFFIIHKVIPVRDTEICNLIIVDDRTDYRFCSQICRQR